MEKKLLIINIGSGSKKYALYEGDLELAVVHMEKESEGLIATIRIGDNEEKVVITQEQYSSSVAYVLELISSKNLVSSSSDISGIGLRIVAPGSYFLANKIIDAEYLDQLSISEAEAPLHIQPVIEEIKKIKEYLPSVPLVGISDSLFHATMPELSRSYSLPHDIAEKYGIYRYGYHGISAHSVLRKLESKEALPSRIIICHLGSGISITAVKDGKSVDTSMGFSPLEGIIMGTRIGNIDAGAVIYLAQKSGMSLSDLETFFNTKCGLLGLSGRTNDVRELIELEKGGDQGAKLALDSLSYQVKKYIGSYTAILGGLDLLVFTATIGERSHIIRHRVCQDMEALGIIIDESKNQATVSIDGVISGDSSKVKVVVVTTNELKEIAKETSEVILPAS